MTTTISRAASGAVAPLCLVPAACGSKGAKTIAATSSTSTTAFAVSGTVTTVARVLRWRHRLLVGFGDAPLLLKSVDKAATWTDASSKLDGVVKDTGSLKLHTCFALGSKDVWVGGERSLLAYSSTGGE